MILNVVVFCNQAITFTTFHKLPLSTIHVLLQNSFEKTQRIPTLAQLYILTLNSHSFFQLAQIQTTVPCFPKNKTRTYINFCSENAVGVIFRGCFIFFMYNNIHLFKYSHVIFFWLLHNGGGRGFI